MENTQCVYTKYTLGTQLYQQISCFILGSVFNCLDIFYSISRILLITRRFQFHNWYGVGIYISCFCPEAKYIVDSVETVSNDHKASLYIFPEFECMHFTYIYSCKFPEL